MRKLSLFFALCLLTGCGAIEQLTLPLKSDAYKLGYQVGAELKDAAQGVADINSILAELNEWTNANLSELENPEMEIDSTCNDLFELSGLVSSLQGFEIDNNAESKVDFVQGCVAGFGS